MRHDYDYLIIGAGMVADAAARGIRELDAEGTIGVLGEEQDPPVTRPALSKKLWTDPEFGYDQIFPDTSGDTGAALRLGVHVSRIDRAAKRVETSDGGSYGYGKLLIGTGGAPKRLELPASERVLYYRTVEDYRKLRELAGEQRHVAVVGGGFIGTELAAALVQNGARTTLILPERTLGESQFPAALAERLHQTFLDHGVELIGGHEVVDGEERGGKVVVRLDDGLSIEADAVVIGLGITPNQSLAEQAGLAVDEGIIVDARLATEDPDIFAAGDVAKYPDAILGRQRVEHVDNAKRMGRCAGRIMAGSDERYTYTPYFYSVLFDLGYQAIGRLSSQLQMAEEWLQAPAQKGTVYYLDDHRLVGVLLVGFDADEQAEKLDHARGLLADKGPFDPDTLVGRKTD
ncbi:NAD(P)/FAD-dependent oxidoreductase [Halotalea alkalilenta]|uniref:NAD(P)/FAD-dependent oxidoreductase n=1 Tax=Halotalea alkalilenta TaxID=376489 RepID=UPI0005B981A8|nr:FAD-dependent oxidoreductase [Halotalea alkalilenta]